MIFWGDGETKELFVSGDFSPPLAIFRQRSVLLGPAKGFPPHALYHWPPDCPWGAEDTTCAKGVHNLLGDEAQKGSQHQSQGTMCSLGSGSSVGIHSHCPRGRASSGRTREQQASRTGIITFPRITALHSHDFCGWKHQLRH